VSSVTFLLLVVSKNITNLFLEIQIGATFYQKIAIKKPKINK